MPYDDVIKCTRWTMCGFTLQTPTSATAKCKWGCLDPGLTKVLILSITIRVGERWFPCFQMEISNAVSHSMCTVLLCRLVRHRQIRKFTRPRFTWRLNSLWRLRGRGLLVRPVARSLGVGAVAPLGWIYIFIHIYKLLIFFYSQLETFIFHC